MQWHLPVAVVGRVVAFPAGKTPQLKQSPVILSWSWCSERAGVLCAVGLRASVAAKRGAAPAAAEQGKGKRDDSRAGADAGRVLALALSQAGHPGPLLWDTGLSFPICSSPAPSSFCACPPESNPGTGLFSPERQKQGW